MKFSAKLFAAVALCLCFSTHASQVAMPTFAHNSGPATLIAYNSAFAAVSTMQSGSSDPGTNGGPYSFWADTGNGLLKQRNAANTAWVAIGPLLTTYSDASLFTSGTVASARLPAGSTSTAGILQLTNSSSSTSTTTAATPNSVKNVNDVAFDAQAKAVSALAFGNFKAFGTISTTSPSILGGYNYSTLTKNGTGDVTITLSQAVASAAHSLCIATGATFGVSVVTCTFTDTTHIRVVSYQSTTGAAVEATISFIVISQA